MNLLTRPVRWVVLLALAAAGAAGCGQALPPEAEPDQAREALRVALEAWKKGQRTDDLMERDPPIYFNDPRARGGRRLFDYKLEDGHTFHGQSARLTAILTLGGKDGTAKERKAAYHVDTSPAIVIVPE